MDTDLMAQIDDASPEQLEQMLTEQPQEKPADAPQEQPAQEEPTLEERLKQLEERTQKYEKQLKDKDDFINQRNAEVGLLRKQLRDKQKAGLGPELTNDEILENPKAAIEKAIERAKAKEQLDKEEHQAAMQDAINQTRQLFSSTFPKFDEVKAHALEVMKADGAPAEMVNQFEADPAATMHMGALFQLVKRAELYKEIKELRAKLEEAEKRTSKITDNVAKFASAKSPTSAAPTSPKKSGRLDSLTEADIDKMSLEELKELQKELY